MISQSIQSSIQEGLQYGRGLARERENAVAKAFNEASELIEALNFLKKMPESKFDFAIRKDPSFVGVYIDTNIPIENYNKGTVCIVAYPNGQKTLFDASEVFRVQKTDAGATQKVTKYVAQYAAKNGLIP